MRNTFDQYTQPENRITHALMTALNEDRKLLRAFLKELLKITPQTNVRELTVFEQQFPGQPEPQEDELDRLGIPDGWICDKNGWCVFIESKIFGKTLITGQITSHRRTSTNRGFSDIIAVAIVVTRPTKIPQDTVVLEWTLVYKWLKRHSSRSSWAAHAAEYLEIAEAKLVDSEQFKDGSLTTFSGFPFGNDKPYTYLEGKRLLSLAMRDLRSNRELVKKLSVQLADKGRKAIRGKSGDVVWNYLALAPLKSKSGFTKHPHLTLAINRHSVEATVTVPNSVNRVMRRNLKLLGEAGFQQMASDILRNLTSLLRKNKGATPWFRGVQRRYPSQSAPPLIDAQVECDLRTAVFAAHGPKLQPNWLAAGYASFVNKSRTNYQIQIGVIFRYDRCSNMKHPDALKLIAAAWIACKPLVDLAR